MKNQTPKKTIVVNLPYSTVQMLDKIAEKWILTRTATIRKLIEEKYKEGDRR